MKKLLSISIAALMTIGLTNVLVPQQVNSEETSPKLIYTDTWTTSYFIDDDTETLYPYIECTADVFSDKTLRISFGNTHKLEDPVEDTYQKTHYVTIVGTAPYNNNTNFYFYSLGKTYTDSDKTYTSYPVNTEIADKSGAIHRTGNSSLLYLIYPDTKELITQVDTDPTPDYSFWENNKASIYPSLCSITYDKTPFKQEGFMEYTEYRKDAYGTNNKIYVNIFKQWQYYGLLSELPVGEKQTITFKTSRLLIPNIYTIFGKEINVDELVNQVSGVSTTPTPTTAPTQSNADKIKELEAQVKTLTEENEKLKSRNVFDLNDDGKVNVLDLIKLKNYLLGI